MNIIIIRLRVQMKKRVDKVVLKSEIFKLSATPQRKMPNTSKSPLTRTPNLTKMEQQGINPNELFQKICCPNCRYIFKTIKDVENFATINNRKKQKSKQMISLAIQTQDLLSKEIVDFKSISLELTKQISPKNYSVFSKTSYVKNSIINKRQEKDQKSHLKQSSYKFQDISPSKHPSKIIRKYSEIKTDKIEQSKKNKPKQQEINKGLHLQENNQKKTKQKQDLVKLILKLYHRGQQASFTNTFIKLLPETIEVPSFQKMLLLEPQSPTFLQEEMPQQNENMLSK